MPTATAVKVVDASAFAALLFGEPAADVVAGRLRGARLVAPMLFGFELANVCLMKCRRHPELREALRAAFRMRHRLLIQELAVEPDGVLDLAERTGLTAYDASYLWLSRRLGAELVSLDKALQAAARQA